MLKLNSQPVSESACIQVISEKIKSDDFRIVKYKCQTYEEKNGFLGEHSRLEVEIERNGILEEFAFFVKALPTTDGQRDFVANIGGFFKESSFFGKYLSLLYKHSIDVLDSALPKCYLATEEVLVFDELKIEGYLTLDSTVPLELSYVEAALAAFARLHASGFILEDRLNAKLNEDLEKELVETFYSQNDMVLKAFTSNKQGLNAFIDFTHDDNMKLPKQIFKEIGHKAIDEQRTFAKPTKKYKNTICHADPWVKNFLFKPSENGQVHCIAIDFQTYRYAPPAQDVIAFLHLVTDRNFRNQHLNDLLHSYYKQLRNHLEEAHVLNIITEEEFRESVRYYRQFALVQAITHSQLVNLSKKFSELLFANEELVLKVMFEDKYEFMMKVCKEDDVYGERTREIVGELREFFEELL